jgi:hypothetical protein
MCIDSLEEISGRMHYDLKSYAKKEVQIEKNYYLNSNDTARFLQINRDSPARLFVALI